MRTGHIEVDGPYRKYILLPGEQTEVATAGSHAKDMH